MMAALALVASACAEATPVPVTPPAEVVTPAPPPAATASTPPEEPLPPREEALAQGRALAEAWNAGPRHQDDELQAAWIRKHKIEETTLRRQLEAIVKPCLSEREREAPGCKPITDDGTDIGKVTEVLVQVLAEAADPAPLGGASLRLLVRLEARGLWRAGSAIERVLERRLIASAGTCAPPSAAEIEAARRSLADFAVVTPAAPPAKGLAARWPTAAEIDEMAYLQAAVADAGPQVGHAEEDRAASKLPADHPDLAARARLRDELQDALLDGEFDHYLRAADAYLRTLGYPQPMRLAEEGDARWGGAGASFVMRDAARAAEIVGRYDVAEGLYRRAQPGGGACGTSTPSRRDAQIEGAIRAAEQGRGCRAAVAERLFAVNLDLHHAYGPERLAKAGFDVAKLYAGALHTLGRDDKVALEQALQGLPSRSGEALARLGRSGTEAWATRVRAIHGYADTARGSALDRLLGIAEQGSAPARIEALDALGMLAEDRGWDPCIKTEMGFGWGFGSSRLERRVHNVMGTCETRIDARSIDGAVRRVAAMTSDPDPGLREGAAVALGRLGARGGRKALAQLAKDRYDAGGQVCTTRGNGPQVCEPNRPVARAAKEGLEALARADELRAKQRAAKKRK
ncbi:MAG: hypothetical protein QM820_22230 [Minicystis sp.]